MSENASKKKLIVALSTLCAVLLVSVVTMGIVWAATSQTITSNVKVIYTASEVSGSISSNIYFTNDTARPMTLNGAAVTTDPSNTEVAFNGETTTTTGTLMPQAADQTITLRNATGERFVIYEYIISNASTNDMSAVLTYTDDSTNPNIADTNVKVYAYASTTAVSTPHTNVSTLYGTSEANLLASATGQFFSDTVAASGTKYFYIVVAINDLANDAEFSGTFSWNLTKATA